jgi:hypothetical protein
MFSGLKFAIHPDRWVKASLPAGSDDFDLQR